MTLQVSAEVQAAIERHIASGRFPDAEHVLIDALSALDERVGVLEDIRLGIQDWQEGNVQTLEEIAEEFDRTRGWKNPL
ncbi:MAG: hypothetical protein QM811_01000 [Pirellulales bacterium]